MSRPVQLAEKIFLIDGHDLGWEQRTGSYLLAEEKLTLIETSASPSVPHILVGLKALGISPEEIRYIIVTHIHLDHAGGAGLLLEHCPHAEVVVHPKGARHLINPERLIAGARAVYGEKFDELFNPIIPVPENRHIGKADQETLMIGRNCTLTFYDTPGHANHHFSIHHSTVNGIFTGDTAGVSYPQLKNNGLELYLPSTSPNQFDPDKMRQSIDLYEQLNVDYIFFGHYGMSDCPGEVYSQVRNWLNIFVDEASMAYKQGSSFQEQVAYTKERLAARVSSILHEKGITQGHAAETILSLDLNVCSMGLIDYLQKQTRITGESAL
ncbi:MBL fold metallo-hydrolase [Bacillus canaveralius]|uniref:MBL fold metallo-hydrolase n=1 Tax=Bacillus canaveralius TaxID=1403243 RepID=A0A2N5GJI6_9BACI|nr:MBL fold metallo-hydrolase [Bacillus canaveralius]PLR81399.1 MBL fold metallo-hydrolase [Bacillus canaveralius]PLR90061.1 MBL fold metallo-hydrolase [Bacillus canaveralius]